jgi:hypothetical protein
MVKNIGKVLDMTFKAVWRKVNGKEFIPPFKSGYASNCLILFFNLRSLEAATECGFQFENLVSDGEISGSSWCLHLNRFKSGSAGS